MSELDWRCCEGKRKPDLGLKVGNEGELEEASFQILIEGARRRARRRRSYGGSVWLKVARSGVKVEEAEAVRI